MKKRTRCLWLHFSVLPSVPTLLSLCPQGSFSIMFRLFELLPLPCPSHKTMMSWYSRDIQCRPQWADRPPPFLSFDERKSETNAYFYARARDARRDTMQRCVNLWLTAFKRGYDPLKPPQKNIKSRLTLAEKHHTNKAYPQRHCLFPPPDKIQSNP